MGVFSTIWEQIGLKDLVDILIVAILVYQFILIVRGTRAVQMLFGVAALGILFWFGVSYKLYSLNWLLAHFFESFFVIVVILFQDQVRGALASFGRRSKVFGGLSRSQLEAEIDEVVEAAGALRREKIGGLIVFERANGLANYMETGTRINSKIHCDLLYAIFQTNVPLHDGAVIISGGELAAVGCFLPLSQNTEVDRKLGTRHRAALGMSEVTDAVVVIISEETGSIKLCLDGEFYECTGEKQLRVYLKHLWANSGLEKNLVPELKSEASVE